MTVNEVQALGAAIRAEIGKAVVGHDATVDLLLVALFAGGHILLEGPPGTAKTLLAHSFAQTLGLKFGRIQFTPDLMPGDIIGANLFNFQTSAFTLTRGPIFTELLLADEINRTSPKTQAALLEAMQERSVTIDGECLALCSIAVKQRVSSLVFSRSTFTPIAWRRSTSNCSCLSCGKTSTKG